MKLPSTAMGILLGTSLACGAAIAACGSSGGAGTASVSSGSGASSSTDHGGASTSTGTSTGAGLGGGTFFEGGVGDAPFTPDGDACGSVALQGNVTPGNIVVVFDQSDSMSQKFAEPDGGAGLPKWETAEQALVAAVTPIESLLRVGAIFQPTGADGACTSAPITTAPQIPLQSAASFVTSFQDHFSAPGWKLILGTPLKQGLDQANAALTPAPAGHSAVVILTDGVPNCGYSTVAEVDPPIVAMAARGIKTYAIGLPGSASAASVLDGLAQAGGTGQYISPAAPADLQAALAKIASDTFDQCTIVLSPPPADPSLVHLIVTDPANPTGVVVPESTDGGGNGWSLAADGATATLLGTTCATAEAGGYTSVTFVYGCPMLPQ